MQKTILTYGLIMGALISVFMVISMHFFCNSETMEGSVWLGFGSMIAIYGIMFFAIKSYRDKQNGGFISFGKAFKMAVLLVLVTSTMYVISWLIYYYGFVPDFMDRYSAAMLKQEAAKGLSGEELVQKTAEVAQMKEMYKSPLVVILFTYLEILPVGLIIALVSSLLLMKKQKAAIQD